MNLLLIPGFMTDKALWRDMKPALSSLGVITYGDISQGEDLREIALHNIALSPNRFVLVGFSLGGYVARWIASLAPERVQALVLIATSNQPDSDSQKAVKSRTAEMVNKESFGGLSPATIRTSLHACNRENKHLVEYIRAMSLRLGPEVFVRQLKLQRDNPPPLSSTLHCPILIIASAGDELRTLADAEALQHEFPVSTLRIIEGAGHMLPLEQPEILVKVVSTWLEESIHT
ncbi:Pimelyl-[acyl-carrier protein] methyl ester esterase [Serratia entomophila]|uniref:alpha/beta fold hydrolase n=1 Tax=Serratia entomophila TaxID=42906 RepID=UPI001F42F4F0|nr:alpha/beta hydrolase [Serratia entomophila]UIW17165.1 alpha/beta hydrolase [Serratia entomophila]CAI0695605.1 Pimelyl-[acyl-carrier protein] methyl ester esterase [Serratia entomophila]CAI0696085.1 Pimelyl-[acyl-carrier protein] methyl ester esterase [Serratia entomophila]CAI0696440.1 Pimelyl-[acyl-carrier protein] methyl ester esterase [Serratia entomophila]CAI0696586.1 Pimelyl-[acyl-carrier protein] methyl ester esterase [Serratia entomophila]